jgi:hypothetical protein
MAIYNMYKTDGNVDREGSLFSEPKMSFEKMLNLVLH